MHLSKLIKKSYSILILKKRSHQIILAIIYIMSINSWLYLIVISMKENIPIYQLLMELKSQNVEGILPNQMNLFVFYRDTSEFI